jgi:hypothetical protein
MKLRSERVLAALAAIALAAALGLAAPVGAAEGNKTKTKITIKRIGVGGASGKVISKRGGCEPHRKVTLFRYDDFISTKVKITQSDSHGNWRVRKSLEPGKYFAKVDSAKAAGTHCLYDVSKNAHV